MRRYCVGRSPAPMPRAPMTSGMRAPVDSPRKTRGRPRRRARSLMCPILRLLVRRTRRTHHREIVGDHGRRAAVDADQARDLAVRGRAAAIGLASRLREQAELGERAGVGKVVDALACVQDPGCPAAERVSPRRPWRGRAPHVHRNRARGRRKTAAATSAQFLQEFCIGRIVPLEQCGQFRRAARTDFDPLAEHLADQVLVRGSRNRRLVQLADRIGRGSRGNEQREPARRRALRCRSPGRSGCPGRRASAAAP